MLWNLYDEKDAKWKATQPQVLYLMTRVMATSTTREKLKQLIGSETDVGTTSIVVGMTMIDIRAAPQNRGDIVFQALIWGSVLYLVLVNC